MPVYLPPVRRYARAASVAALLALPVLLVLVDRLVH
jgi:hypothetical protein